MQDLVNGPRVAVSAKPTRPGAHGAKRVRPLPISLASLSSQRSGDADATQPALADVGGFRDQAGFAADGAVEAFGWFHGFHVLDPTLCFYTELAEERRWRAADAPAFALVPLPASEIDEFDVGGGGDGGDQAALQAEDGGQCVVGVAEPGPRRVAFLTTGIGRRWVFVRDLRFGLGNLRSSIGVFELRPWRVAFLTTGIDSAAAEQAANQAASSSILSCFAFGAVDVRESARATPTMRPRITPLILLLCLASPAVAEPASSSFRVTANIEKRVVSDDGRYAVVGQALRKPEATSADGRYALKSSAATCNPSEDNLFRNGFENP